MRGSVAFKIGLTGGIGSGKSTVSTFLTEFGAAVIDADFISRALTQPGGAAIPRISATFGVHILNSDGGLNRQTMRDLVFSDANSRQKLQGILHPLIRNQMLVSAAQAKVDGFRTIVFDIPLLIESGAWRQSLDKVLVIDCSPTVQIHRVMQRNQLSQMQVEQIIASQATRSQRVSAADFVIFNSDITLAKLRGVAELLRPEIGL